MTDLESKDIQDLYQQFLDETKKQKTEDSVGTELYPLSNLRSEYLLFN